jgi:hypothetical protein
MSRSLLTPVGTIVLALVLAAGTVIAAPLHARGHALVGTLQKVDGQTLTIKTAKGTEDVTLAPSARIHVGSKTMTAADLNHETGARVKVRYTEKSGQKQAQSVAVSPAHTGSQSARADSKPAPKVNRK